MILLVELADHRLERIKVRPLEWILGPAAPDDAKHIRLGVATRFQFGPKRFAVHQLRLVVFHQLNDL